MQCLREIRLHRNLAGADGFTRGASEGSQKIRAGFAVGDFDRARAQRQSLELVFCLRHLADGIEHDFRAHPAHGGVREVARVEFVRRVRPARQLVGGRAGHVAHEFFEVEIVFGQLLSKQAEQLAVRRRVADPHVIHRVDDAAPQKVLPDQVGDVIGKIRIFLRRKPLAERGAAVAVLRVGCLRAEKFRRHNRAGERVFCLAVATVEDDRLARILAFFPPDLLEKCDKALVVAHRPPVERMVVALRALDADAEKNLSRVLREFERIDLGLVIVGRRIFKVAAGGGKDVARDLVQRDVVRELVLQPVVVNERLLVADLVVVRAHAQQLGPFHHPEIGELMPREQRIDELCALVRIGAGEKAVAIFGRGQHPDGVDENTAQKLLVAAQLRGNHAQPLEFPVDRAVDVIFLRHPVPCDIVPLRDDDDLRADGEGVEARHHERLAALRGGDETAGRDFRGVVVVAEKERERGHVAQRAVGVFCADNELLRRVFTLENDGLRHDLRRDRHGHVRTVARRAGFDPADDGVVEFVVFLEPLPAGVRDEPRALRDEQALVRQREVDAARAHFTRDALVVAVGVESKK